MPPDPLHASPNPYVIQIDPSQPSHIQRFTYDPGKATLTVHFHASPKPYVHTDVPRELFDHLKQWTSAGYSPGSFYHSHIKRYPIEAR